jgi:catechol 2,3-dioxygenase-like lactoylglutathione lyase family enzyme
MIQAVEAPASGLHIAQIGLNTCDLAGSLRLYREVFGFCNAGGNALWGDVMRIQGLDAQSRSLIWWMVGASAFFQLEFFHHTNPKQRPLPADWRPCDLGWVRFGLEVPNFEAVASALARANISTLAPATRDAGSRRLAFRDPYIGIVVEVIESPEAAGSVVNYVTSSVADLGAARRFYGEVIGAELQALGNLHVPAAESLWGLGGAVRDGFLARIGERCIEVVNYRQPLGRSQPDRRISDQGIMNVALASRDVPTIRALLDRIRADGHQPTSVLEGPDFLGTYIVDPGYELEVFASPESRDELLGFRPVGPFVADFAAPIDENN